MSHFSSSTEKPGKDSVRGRSRRSPFSAHLAVSYTEKVLTLCECLWFFFKASASVQTITTDEDCLQCAL